MAWSAQARFHAPLPGHAHKTCANCKEYALLWRERVLAASRSHQQQSLPLGGIVA
jgi:hypothetical protein